MSRWGKRMPRDFNVDAYMTKLHGESKRGPIGQVGTLPIFETADIPDIFQAYCAANGLAMPVREYRFHPQRRWRFDYAYIANKIAIEIDGGAWTQGRHTRGAGFVEDQKKLNEATKLGWCVLRYTHDRYADAIADLKIMLAK